MNTPDDLLRDLLVEGTELWIEDGNLRVRAPSHVLTPSRTAALRQHKPEILRLLPDFQFVAPLSAGQEALWFIQKSSPDSVAYNLGLALRIESAHDHRPALRRALQNLCNRHAGLRTTYTTTGEGSPRQLVRAHRALDLEEIDLAGQPWDHVLRAAAAFHQKPFELDKEPAFRARLFRTGPDASVLVLCIHHIASDGWSFRMMVGELFRLYESDGQPIPLPPVKRTYQQFVDWQRAYLADKGEALRRFWVEELADASMVLDLPTTRTRPAAQTFRGATETLILDPALTSELRAFARHAGTTLYTVLLSTFQILLHRYTGQEDLCVGSPAAGRDREEFSDAFGYMVNPIVLRARISATEPPSFNALVQETRDRLLRALDRQDYPFPWLARELLQERDPSRSPIFQVMFVYQREQNAGESMRALMAGTPVEVAGTRFSAVSLPQVASEVDLVLEAAERPEQVELGFRYNTDLFDANAVARMAGHFQTLLRAIIATPDCPVSQLPLLSDTERVQVLEQWNQTTRHYDRDRGLHGLVEAQAALTPDLTAVLSQDGAIHYGDLNRRANQLARYLQTLGVGPETPVAVRLHRSIDLIVSLLAILKSGGAYLPIDPAYPIARQQFMLEDSGAPVLVTQRMQTEPLPTAGIRVLLLDDEAAAIAAKDDHNLDNEITGDRLAYLLYTSGSTGQPKAVAIEHHGPVALIEWARTVYSADDLRGVFASTSISFDISVFEIFAPLAAGGCVILADNALALPAHPARERVTLINTVPSAMAALLRSTTLPPSVRVVNLAGEALGNDLVQTIYEQSAVDRVYNLYGPTEDTVYSTWCLVPRGQDCTPPIGRPIANTQAYILDAHLQPLPVGVPGELYLGGAGLARGYHRRPEITKERFIANPLGAGRLYRTGDLARFRADGDIDYLGRLDHQIKLRGFRIELGEIEAALEKQSDIEKVVVMAHEQRLVAYYTTGSPESRPGSALRAHLLQVLPEFMVPEIYIRLDAFPLTSNGKVNRRALPAPRESDLERHTYVAPETPTERALAALWRDILGLERVGKHDNFFRLGGHSLLAVQVVARLPSLFQIELPAMALFETPTVQDLARRIDTVRSAQRLLAERDQDPSAKRTTGRI